MDEYARAKRLPVEFLRGLGIRDVRIGQGDDRHDAVAIPYLDERGEEVAARYRHAMTGDRRFTWRRGAKVLPYGLNRLAEARKAGHVILVEGESDCHALWFAGFPALGLPGATTWRPEWASFLDGIATVYVVQEPDKAGAGMVERLAKTPGLRDRLRVVRLPDGAKDPSEVWLGLPDGLDDEGRKEAFRAQIEAAMAAAVPVGELEAEAARKAAAEALEKAGPLARSPDILAELERILPRLGLVGEADNAKLLYLAVTSRLLERPVHVVVEGPSSAGKTHLVKTALKLLPDGQAVDATAMSSHALFYMGDDLQHKTFFVQEAAGLADDLFTYGLRSLLSENRLRYPTVLKGPDGLQAVTIEKAGPTQFITTTTKLTLDFELETRLLRLTTDASPEQTRRIIEAQAESVASPQEPPDLTPWHALQQWLASNPAQVIIPFAPDVAKRTKAVAVRLRRDMPALWSLVQAHALLHRANREPDAQGRVVATLDDYAAVVRLVGPLIQRGAKTAVPPAMREVIEQVERLEPADGGGVTVQTLARELKRDERWLRRLLAEAAAEGYLIDLEERPGPGRPHRYRRSREPLPVDEPILPSHDEMARVCVATPAAPESPEALPKPSFRPSASGDPAYARTSPNDPKSGNGVSGSGVRASSGETAIARIERRHDGSAPNSGDSGVGVDGTHTTTAGASRRRGVGVVLE
ncbi:MAG: hypothetical protein IMX02_06265 [Limnochordaceae bacterium]|nr:hypothetical protein [Limnochordaceae bacterium]